MSHLHRFYIGPDAPDGGEVCLSPEETHHALHVVRVRQGDPVALFDGCGGEWAGVVQTAGRREAVVRLGDVRREPAPARALTVVQAWLDNDKAVEQLVRRLTELGVRQIVFFRAERSQRPVRVHDKLQRAAIDAAKQCGRLWLPELAAAASLSDLVTSHEDPLLLATRDVPPVPLRKWAAVSRATLLIGPEGDFTQEELQLAVEHGADAVSLGAAVYRAEVAAGLAASLVLYEWGCLGPLP